MSDFPQPSLKDLDPHAPPPVPDLHNEDWRKAKPTVPTTSPPPPVDTSHEQS